MKKQKLRQVVAEILEADPDSLRSETDLRALTGFDSVNILSLMIALDEQAGIKLGPEEATTLQFFGEIEKLALSQGVTLED